MRIIYISFLADMLGLLTLLTNTLYCFSIFAAIILATDLHRLFSYQFMPYGNVLTIYGV